MRIIHFILMFLLPAAFQPVGVVEVRADENARHDVYRERLLKELLDEDRRISSLTMFNLGYSYLPGNNPQDHIRAYMWFTISAARHKAHAFYALTSREKLKRKMTLEQIESAEQMAHQWMIEHWGHAPVGLGAADFKELQRRLVAGDKGALDEIIRRAESSDQAAQIELGEMYWWGIAVKANPEKAIYWWTRAADEGKIEMMLNTAAGMRSGPRAQLRKVISGSPPA
jgi:TPR repeat protein